MRRVLRILAAFTVNAVQHELQYRANLLLELAGTVLGLVAGLGVLLAMVGGHGQVGGWTFDQALAVLGAAVCLDGIYGVALKPNLGRMTEYVRLGTLDHMLLQPVDSQFQVSFRYVNIWSLPEVALGLGLIGYAMAVTGAFSASAVLLCLLLLAVAAVIVYAIVLMLMTTAIWIVRADYMIVFLHTFLAMGRFPVSAFPPWLRIVFMAVLPLAFVTTVPAAAAVGRLDAGLALAGVGVAALLFALSRRFWQRAIASYTSASS